MKSFNANQPTLNDIVFEHRNKEYGAYELRTNYPIAVNRAFFIGVGAFLLLFLVTFLFAQQSEKSSKLTEVELDPQKIPNDKLPEIEKLKIEKPKKELEQLKTITYLVPEVVEETTKETPPPSPDEMENSIISNKTQDGRESENIAETPPVETPPAAAIVGEIMEDDTPFITVEEIPTFVGGTSEMYKFLAKNLKYPSAAQRANIQGKVFLKFIIEKDGTITAVDVMKGIGFGCDEEATRVVKLMPNWKAGRQNGRNVRVMFTIPVFFKLDD